MSHTENTQKEKSTKSNKRHTDIIVGIGFLLLSAIFAFLALSQPKISVENTQNEVVTDNSISSSSSSTSSSVQAVTQAENTTSAVVSSTTQRQTAATQPSVVYPLNLNTCTAAELMTIDKIGEARAGAIISYRDYLGGYTSVEQLKNISGIGDAVYAAIEPYVTV